MHEGFPDYLDVDYTDGENEDPADYPDLESKMEKAIEVTRIGLQEYENPAVMWTGGKDSTLTLYFVKEVAEQYDLELPPTIFIDHFQHFDELIGFVERWADEWDLDVVWARNDDVGQYVDEHGLEPGDDVPVDGLNEQNQHHVRNLLEYEEDTFPFLLDTYVGNHLLKTVALNNALEEHDVDVRRERREECLAVARGRYVGGRAVAYTGRTVAFAHAVPVAGVGVAVCVALLGVLARRVAVAEGHRGRVALFRAAAIDAGAVVSTTAEHHAHAHQRARDRASKVHAARIARVRARLEVARHRAQISCVRGAGRPVSSASPTSVERRPCSVRSTRTSAPKAVSISSVWSRVASGSITLVSPGAFRPASSTADFTCALATGSS